MKLGAKITIVYEDERVARAVARALAPDNAPLPRGLRVTTRQDGRTVRSEVAVSGTLETFLNTLDDLLACTQAAESVIARRR